MTTEQLEQLLLKNKGNNPITQYIHPIIAGIRHSLLESILPLVSKDGVPTDDTKKEMNFRISKHTDFLFRTVLYFYKIDLADPTEFHVSPFLLPNFELNELIFGILIYKEETDYPISFSLTESPNKCDWGISKMKLPTEDVRLPLVIHPKVFILEDQIYLSNAFSSTSQDDGFNPNLRAN